jgi:hypothetical protein
MTPDQRHEWEQDIEADKLAELYERIEEDMKALDKNYPTSVWSQDQENKSNDKN